MKWPLVLGIVFGLSLVAFFGAGFGVGALAVAPSASSYQVTYYNDGSATGGALVGQVYVQTQTVPMVTAMAPGDLSTSLSFGFQFVSNGNCAKAGQPASAVGWEPAYFTLQFISGGSTQQVNWVESNQYGSQNFFGTTLVVSLNNTQQNSATNPWLVYCGYNSVTTNDVTSGNLNQELAPTVVQLEGLVGAGVLNISFTTQGALCGGNSATAPVNDCEDANNAANIQFNEAFPGNDGTWQSTSYADIPVVSGVGQMAAIPNGQWGNLWFNGGTLSLAVSTGYAGPGGWQVKVYNSEGQIASGWGPSNPMNVANFLSGATITFNIPNDASSNCTTNGCNTYSVQLFNSLFDQAAITIPIDISPQYAPGTPLISFEYTSSTYYPTDGTGLTIVMNATGGKLNLTITEFALTVYYLPAGESARSPPGCGSAYVTPCSGQYIPAVESSPNSYSATYTFTINAPVNDPAIGIEVLSVTKNQQYSAVQYANLNIQPATCSGLSCGPPKTTSNLWSVLGPVLLSIVFLTGALFAAVVVPVSTNLRYLVAAIGPILIILMLVTGAFHVLFAPGGTLNAT